jgi:hypothetical protein
MEVVSDALNQDARRVPEAKQTNANRTAAEHVAMNQDARRVLKAKQINA